MDEYFIIFYFFWSVLQVKMGFKFYIDDIRLICLEYCFIISERKQKNQYTKIKWYFMIIVFSFNTPGKTLNEYCNTQLKNMNALNAH